MRRNFFSLGLIVVFVLFGSWAVAQVTTGTILGTVSDSTGAVVPGASVAVRNVETGIARTVTTDAAGRYRAAQLGLGNYEVTAEVAGFQTVVRSGITLTVGREATVDFTLQVGAVTERITVTGEAPMVETTSATVSSLVEGTTVREMPLNGRSFDQLVLLQPGAFLAKPATGGVPGFGQNTAWISISGARPTQTITLLDGSSINSLFYRAGSGVGGRNLGVDSVREFRVLTSSYSAEYGRTNGGVINVVTQSGTNDFHGSAFWFLRNSALDAKNFFDRPDPTPIPPFKRNQFGLSMGGPIVRDQTFFFGLYEGLRDRLGVTQRIFVPSMKAREGILPDRTVTVDPVIKPFLNLYPVPNGPEIGGGLQQHTASATQPTDQNFLQGRIDHQISDNHSVFGRYTQDRADTADPQGGDYLSFPKTGKSGNYMTTLQWTAILSPTVLNTARFGYSRIGHATFGSTEPAILRFGSVFQRIGITRFLGTFADLGRTSAGNNVKSLRNSFQYSDDLTISRGSHTVKLGVLFERFRDYYLYEYMTSWEFAFTTLENFLTKRPLQFRGSLAGADPSAYWRQWLYGFYVQDDWRVNSRLTLNLGLRYEPIGQATNANKLRAGIFGVFADPVRDTTFTLVKHPLRENFTLRNLAPRFGFAWDVFGDSKTAVRGGFGMNYEPFLAHFYTFWANSAPPQVWNVTIDNPDFPNPFLKNPYTNGPFSGEEASDYNTTASPSTMQFNLNIQRQLPGQMAFQIGYVGGLSRHLGMGREANYAVATILPDGRYFIPPANRGKRANPNLGHVGLRYFEANSSYNSLQISLRKSMSRGFQWQANYTWSKSIDDYSSVRLGESGGGQSQDIQNAYCLACERGLSEFDRRHVFNANFTYELPLGPGHAVGGNLTGVAGKLLGGWEISNIATLNSGLPNTAILTFDRAAGLSFGAPAPSRPDLAPGQSNNPTSGVTAGCPGVAAGLKLGDPNKWFDPCAFVLQPEGFFGNAGRNIIIGAGLVNFDFSVVKNTRWGEKFNIQFRSEFFNIFNHPNFSYPLIRVIASPTGVRTPTAGRITSTTTDSRQIQFGVKLMF